MNNEHNITIIKFLIKTMFSKFSKSEKNRKINVQRERLFREKNQFKMSRHLTITH